MAEKRTTEEWKVYISQIKEQVKHNNELLDYDIAIQSVVPEPNLYQVEDYRIVKEESNYHEELERFINECDKILCEQSAKPEPLKDIPVYKEDFSEKHPVLSTVAAVGSVVGAVAAPIMLGTLQAVVGAADWATDKNAGGGMDLFSRMAGQNPYAYDYGLRKKDGDF